MATIKLKFRPSFSTITYSFLAVCGTHGSCIVVFLYDWHKHAQ